MENIDTPSMAISVRFKHRSESDAKNDIRHDLRRGPQPKYVDGTRTRMNTTIVQPKSPAILRDLCIKRRELQPMSRKPKGSFTVASSSIITFGRGLKSHVEALDQERQDELYEAVAEAVAAHLGIELTGLVAHRDEVSPHAHGQHPGRHSDGRPMGKVITPTIASELQDIAMAAAKPFLPMVERGKKKADRIADGDDLSKIINRSVRQLHDDMPKEIQAVQAKLSKTKAKLKKNKRLLKKAKSDLANVDAENKKRTAVIEKRLATYQVRVDTSQEEITSKEAKLANLQSAIDDAEQQAQNIRKITRQEGHQEGLEQGLEEGRQQGREEGLREGRDAAAEELHGLRSEIQKLRDQIKDMVLSFRAYLHHMLKRPPMDNIETYLRGEVQETLARHIPEPPISEDAFKDADTNSPPF